jgi:DNA-binding GntR family transcriptional regulator
MRLSPAHHEKIFQMIKAKDIAGAQELLHMHIQGAKELMLSTLSQEEQMISFG